MTFAFPRAVSTTVQTRGVAGDLLHQIVREGLPVFLRQLEDRERTLPRFVRRELERFSLCGDPTEGFAWLFCEGCDHHVLVPFSCRGRGFCPSCGGRRMAERAAHWIDHVLPHVGVRQWVLTVPDSTFWVRSSARASLPHPGACWWLDSACRWCGPVPRGSRAEHSRCGSTRGSDCSPC